MGFLNYYDNFDEDNSKKGVIAHVWIKEKSHFEKLIIDGIEKEITVFNASFENMLTDHNDVPCIGIIAGHYDLEADYYFDAKIIFRVFKEMTFIGITESSEFVVLDEDSLLIEKALIEYEKKNLTKEL